MTTLRKDTETLVEGNDIEKLTEIRIVFEETKRNLNRVIKQKIILNVPHDKETQSMQQIDANILLVSANIEIVKASISNLLK